MMANTRRESIAPYRNGNASRSAGLIRIPALGFGPHHSTAVDVVCQEFNHLKLPISKPMLSCIASAVDIAFDSHSKTQGSTVSLIHGNMVGQKLYSVSIYPEHTIEVWPPPSWDQFLTFAMANAELLLKPAHALGTWFNDWKLEHVLDVVVLTPDRDAALALGFGAGQLSIFSLETRRVIAVPSPSSKPTAKLVEVGN
jgi:hypothetical protein